MKESARMLWDFNSGANTFEAVSVLLATVGGK